MHPFEIALSVAEDDCELELRGVHEIIWHDFWLNPRKLRGSDFLMRWSQGVWSENRIVAAVNATNRFYAVPYGPSGVAPNTRGRRGQIRLVRIASGVLALMRP